MAVDPCSVCGSKDLNLIDGYYYCVECGTQDTNVRETVIEQQFFADGTFAQTTKRKILINEDKVQMTGEWYKWHTYNFILNGLADELISLGAEASFKTKLLWIWTQYVKKYQKKEAMGLSQQNENTTIFTEDIPKDDIEDEENSRNNTNQKTKKEQNTSTNNISTVTCGLLICMLYVALNLDKSIIQISHLFRFIEEGRLIVSNFNRHIPEDVKVKSIPNWNTFILSCGPCTKMGNVKFRCVAGTLLKTLNLGPPVVPDIRKIIDNYVNELCLPSEFKNLVYSLMYLWPCDFLDVDSRSLKSMSKIPDYEGFAMAYVIVALKMCFGLDDDYEYRLSDVVDKMNKMEKFSKCYKVGFPPEPTGRLFSFREWIAYLQFRRKMLTKNRLLNTNEEHYLDVDDYIFMEYLVDKPPRNKITMTDELSMDIVNKLTIDKEIDVIPKDYFPPTFTPLTTYTEVLSQNLRHTEDVELLSEDFTQYSLNYVCERLHLSELENNDNVIVGITSKDKTIHDGEIMCAYLKGLKNNRHVNMVYVMNCQNKNWLKTNKPTIDHVIFESNENNSKDGDQSDHGYDSNLPSTPSDDGVTEDREESTNNILDIITEEEEDKNIFDDTFEDVVEKEEFEAHENHHVDQIDLHDDQHNPSDDEDRKSVTSTESFEFNPETFNRERAIKELILLKCKTYKIPIPKEYKTIEPRKRKRDDQDDGGDVQRKPIKTAKRGEVKDKVNKLLQAYYSHLENDVMNQVSHQLNLIMNNMDQINPENDICHVDNPDNIEPNNSSIHGCTNVSEISSIAPEHSQINISKLEGNEQQVESILFNEDSDCDNVEDLTVQNDPKFDEAKYDVNQLYIKMDDAEPEDIYESLRDPELDKIIEQQIQECEQTEITATAKRRRNNSSDSEDEIPLSVLREEKEAFLKDVDEKLEPLISNDSIPGFKYWVKRYNTVYMAKGQNVGERFDSEMAENTPKTFSFLLRECATICGCTQFNIYKCLQNIERNLVFCARKGVE